MQEVRAKSYMNDKRRRILPAGTVQEFQHRRTSDAGILSNNDLHFQVFAFAIGYQALPQTCHARF